ncbi:hypothetical protein BDZ94DRAFT_1308694 [Collybia nuda]|uniref:N-acetyltransferase domain-containing protein n=1 Tax=Collybia nuda TaxID=64659 RepID=A0A9P6CF60_9AGAR|nr:hypothetical protein BDZ94DRAFT_1308694 [Collybia nuda]
MAHSAQAPTFNVRQIVPTAENKEDLTKLESISELREIENMLVASFGEPEDLFTAVVTGKRGMGGSQELSGPFWKSTVVAGLLGGEVYIAETFTAPKKIVGCAVWFGPGRAMYDSPDQQAMALGPLMGLFEPPLQAWWGNFFLPLYNKFTSSALGEGTKLGSWHLQTLGVHPEYQRQNVGKHLVDVVAAKATLNHIDMVVECSKEVNVDIYRRLGFETRMPKYKENVPESPSKYDFAEIIKGVHNTLEFPIWVLLRKT